jgi:hypothetical protein
MRKIPSLLQAIFTVAALCGFILTGCQNPIADIPAAAQAAPGYGNITLDLGEAGRAARTVFPGRTGLVYTYAFTKSGGQSQTLTPTNGVFTLEYGSWSVTVTAYAGTVAEANRAAGGTKDFTVSAASQTVAVELTGVTTTGTGTFKYRIQYPQGAAVTAFTLKELPYFTEVSLGTPSTTTSGGVTTMTGTVNNVPAGFYFVTAQFEKDQKPAGRNEVVHIYNGLTSEFGTSSAPVALSAQDFTKLTVDGLAAYLQSLPYNTDETPYTVALAPGTVINTEEGVWATIYSAGKYVNLDLSECSATDNTLNSIYSNPYIKGIILPNSLTSIGDYAFAYCASLTSVTIPSSVTTIGDNAFEDCRELTSVTIPSSVTSIGEDAFEGCQSLTSISVNASNPNYSSENGVLFNRNKTTLIMCPGGKTGSYTIPSSVTSIGARAFYGCWRLTSVTISSYVTSIGASAFNGCTSLTSVTFLSPSRVTSIGDFAFSWCTSLTSVTIPSSVTSIGWGTFEQCRSLTSLTFLSPSSVTSIGQDAFNNCTSLTSVTIPSGVTSIGSGAFWECRSLTSVTIPSSVTSIGIFAFSDCTSLTSVTFLSPSIVASIGRNAFSWCTRLPSVTIPSSVTFIGSEAFGNCSSLTSVAFASGSNITSDNFSGSGYLVYPAFPGNLRTVYLNANPHSGTYTRAVDSTTWTKQ